MSKETILTERFENLPEKLKEAIRFMNDQYALAPVSWASHEVVLEKLPKDDCLLMTCQLCLHSRCPDSAGVSASELAAQAG